MTIETLFGQAFAETAHGSDAATAWTFATQMSSSDPVAAVTAVWWSPPSVAAGTYGWRIYSGHIGETVTLIASGAFGAYTPGGGWQRAAITPVDVAGINFMIAIRSTAGDSTYAYATGKWPHASGTLQSGDGSTGGAFSIAGVSPDTHSALMYMIDAEVTTGSIVTINGTLDATAPAATASLSQNNTGSAVATAPAATAALTEAGANAPDLDIHVGQPRSGWTVGQPRTAWTIGEPR